ncbi:hypothetical protein [Yoonia sp. SDW83-1]|uniref:hypothetical protein n=1 Tax=Yoonia sp. SDW83-1 TaxID=3366945 RepID=UPI00398C6F82
MPAAVALDQLSLAKFEADITEQGRDGAGDDFGELDQPTFHHRDPAELTQETQVCHAHFEQVECGERETDDQPAPYEEDYDDGISVQLERGLQHVAAEVGGS